MSHLRKLRKAHKYTQEYMAEHLNITAPTYTKKELGHLRFSLVEAKAIADLFGKTIEDIFFEDEVSDMERPA